MISENWMNKKGFYCSDMNDPFLFVLFKVGHNCKMNNPCRDDEICLDTCSCPGYECLNCAGNFRNIHCK